MSRSVGAYDDAGAALIPDFLALVGDAADGYPGLDGIGRVTAARLLARHGPLERFPPEVLGERHKLALLCKTLATLRTDARLFADVDELRWRGPTGASRHMSTGSGIHGCSRAP